MRFTRQLSDSSLRTVVKNSVKVTLNSRGYWSSTHRIAYKDIVTILVYDAFIWGGAWIR